MTKEKQAKVMEMRVTEPLFEVTASEDPGTQAKLREKQMAYGILLQSCGLTEKKIVGMKDELNSEVSNYTYYHISTF